MHIEVASEAQSQTAVTEVDKEPEVIATGMVIFITIFGLVVATFITLDLMTIQRDVVMFKKNIKTFTKQLQGRFSNSERPKAESAYEAPADSDC